MAQRKLSNYFKDYRHVIYLTITVSFIVIVAACFMTSHKRIIESLGDFWASLEVFFMVDGAEATVNKAKHR